MAGSREPLWWLLFAAGGTVAAFLVPIHIALSGIAAPAGLLQETFAYDRMRALVTHPLTRLYLFVLIALPLFHWAHRFRFTLVDLGVHSARRLIAVLCYGTAVAGAVATAAVLLTL